MANKLIRGITIEIGGDTTKLGKALEDSEKTSRSLQSELREIDKALKFDPSNVELLAQKQTVLTQNIEATKKKLDILKEAERQVIAQFERGEVAEEQVRALQREIIKCEGALNDMESSANKTGDNVDDLGESAEKAEGGFTVMKGALADLVSNVIQGAISAIGDLVGSLFELSEATEEYRVMQAKLEGSANTFGYSLEFASEKYKEFYGYVGDDQMATNAITNLMGLGTSTDSVSKLAEGAIAVWTAYGDSIPIESLTESINETAQVGKVTGSLADALNWAGISEDEFNKKLERTRNTQERADLIAKTLNKTYGESKTTYDGLAGSVTEANRAELDLKETQAELGETMAPVNTAITNLKNQALEAILPIVKELAEAFLDLLNWLKEHPTAMKVLTAVVITLATAFSVLAIALGIQGLINGVTKAFQFLNTTMLANPAVLITTAIIALVAGFIYLWNTCDGFREFWIGLWDSLKSIVSSAGSAIGDLFSKMWTSTKETWSSVAGWFTAKVVEPTKNAFSNLWDSIKKAGANVVGAVKGSWSAVSKWFDKSVITPVRSSFSSMWKNLKSGASSAWSGVQSIFSNTISWFTNIFSRAWKNVQNVFSSWSSFFSGLWGKITNTFSNIGTKIGDAIGRSVKAGINGIISAIEWTINQGVSLINGAIGLINLIPGVKIGKVNDVRLPRLYRGGVLKKGQVGLLEGDGAEAVVPLEKETKWISRIAQKMNDLQGNNTNVNNTALASKMDEMIQAIKTMRSSIVLDTGVLVGETINQIDAGLSNNYTLRERRV